jgi:[ribosomal protein S18]-alanine N-acetyltransferase
MIERKELRFSPRQVFFREMEKKDLAAVNDIERESFQNPWPPEALAFELEENVFCNAFVMEMDELVAAYAFLWVVDENSHLINIAVAKNLRGNGIGEAFMKHLVGFAANCGAESMRLEVREGNLAAVNLYLKFGFKTVGKEKGYYSNGEDALQMLLVFERPDEP